MKHVVYILISLCVLSCQSNRPAALILDTVESLMTEDPQKAKLILETIAYVDINKSSLHAKYALLYSQALDKNYVDISNDSLIRIAVDYYDRHGDDHEKALAHYYHGRVYQNGNDVDNAIKSYVLSEQSVSRVNDCYLLGLINYNIGHLYSEQHSFSEAQDRFQRSVGYFNNAGAIYNAAAVLSQMGRTYLLMDKCDSAHKKYNEAIEKYKSLDADREIQQLYESIAAIQLDQNEKVDSLKKILRHCYSKLNSGKIPITSRGLWQSIYIKENKLDSARICGHVILDNRELFSNTQLAGCIIQMGQIEYQDGNYKKAYQYSLQYESIIDSIYNETREHIIQEIEQKYNNQILKEANRSLQVRQRYQNIIIVLLIIILVIGGTLITWIFTLWRKKIKQRIKCADAEISRLRSTYSELQGQYDAIKIRVNSNDEKEVKLMEALKARLRGLCDLVENTQTTKSATFVKLFQKYMKVNVRSDISLSDLQYVVNKNYHGIIDYLEANYPKLTKQDLDLCSLLCFGFSQYGICYIYETEIQTFYNKRHRLRERLGLKQNQKIEVFIQDLIQKLAQE